MSPEDLENEKTRRQEQFLTSLPEAIASAEVELSSVFSGVLGSLLTNSEQAARVRKVPASAKKLDPTKVQMVQEDRRAKDEPVIWETEFIEGRGVL